MDVLVGGNEERAILLHNYMSSLNYEVYLILGTAVPEGDTAYVLYRDKANRNNNTFVMINPSTGETVDVKDSTHCSVLQVWALVNRNEVN